MIDTLPQGDLRIRVVLENSVEGGEWQTVTEHRQTLPTTEPHNIGIWNNDLRQGKMDLAPYFHGDAQVYGIAVMNRGAE